MRYLLVCMTSLVLTACASVMSGSTQEIAVTSEPPRARVLIDGRDVGKTPVSVDLERSSRHTLSISLEGYRTKEIALERRINGWVWGNILIGGLIGLVIDSATGAIYRVAPTTVNTRLASHDQQLTDRSGVLLVALASEADQSGQRIGQLEPE